MEKDIKSFIIKRCIAQSELRADMESILESEDLTAHDRKSFETMSDYYLGTWGTLYDIITEFGWEEDYRKAKTEKEIKN